MLLVPVLARGTGLLLEATLGDPRPQGERVLAAVLPEAAALIGRRWRIGGPPAAAAMLPPGGFVRLLPAAAQCHDPRPGAQAVPIPGAAGACLAALPPPRPLMLGLVPSTFRVLLPLLEFLIAGLLSFFLARRLADPILRTRDAAAAFAAGDLAARAPAAKRRWPDEASELARAFNRMAERVAAMIGAQRRFIGDVSHEIRSPLGRLTLALDIARRDAPPALSPRLDRMEQELDGMAALVRELLFLATLDGSAAPPTPEPVAIADLLERVRADLAFESPARAGAITLAVAPDDVVHGNAALLRRALENVLRNALFYTPPGSNVTVTSEAGQATLRIAVRDQGPGVPDDAVAKLFDPFFRVDAARARHTGGAGLGLAIAARAVALHGGQIAARNENPGLCVTISLPWERKEDVPF